MANGSVITNFQPVNEMTPDFSPVGEAGGFAPVSEILPEASWGEVERTIAGNLPANLAAGATGAMALGMDATSNYGIEALMPAVRLLNLLKEPVQYAAKYWYDKAQKNKEELNLKPGSAKSYASMVQESTAQQLPLIAAGVATGGTGFILPAMGVLTAGQKKAQFLSKGIEGGNLNAITQGVIEAATEKIPLGQWLKPGASFMRRLLTATAAEIPGELTATATQSPLDKIALNPEMSWGEFWETMPGQLKDTAIVTIGQSLLMGGPIHGMQSYSDRQATKKSAVDTLTTQFEVPQPEAEKAVDIAEQNLNPVSPINPSEIFDNPEAEIHKMKNAAILSQELGIDPGMAYEYQDEIIKELENKIALESPIIQPGTKPEAQPEASKQPWEMTSEEYLKKINPKNEKLKAEDRPTIHVDDLEGMDADAKPYKNIDSLKLKKDDIGIYAIKDKKVVGYISELSDGEIDLSVAGEYQKQGIGKILLSEFRKEKPFFETGGVTELGLKTEKSVHRDIVKQALSEGKPIPPEVLKDYPELQAQSQGGIPGETGLRAVGMEASKSAETVAEYLGFQEEPKKSVGITGNIPEDIYSANRQAKTTAQSEVIPAIKDFSKDVGQLADEFLGSISTRLGNINPRLKGRLRLFEYDIRQKSKNDFVMVEPLLEGVKRMTPEDSADFDLARKNADTPRIQALTQKYGLQKQYENLRAMLNDVYERAKAVGLDVSYREEFNPRVIKDPQGLIGYLQKSEQWASIEEAIKEKEVELEKYLTVEEKAQVANTMLRGYPQGNITLSKPGALKERQIPIINAELNKFYRSSDSALISYINTVNEAIEARRFFGVATDKKDMTNIDDSIGAYVIEQIARGEIRPDQEAEVSSILKARFNQQRPDRVVSLYRDFSYLDTMGSVTSGITQLGDFAWSLYDAGVKGTIKGVWSAVKGKPILSKTDLGTERVGVEFSEAGKMTSAVQFVFKWTGLNKMDQLAEETLAQSVIQKYQKQVQSPEGIKKLRGELSPVWGEKTTNDMIKDLSSGEITENVKLLAFCRVLDFQPKALSEMPQKYLTGGNGRIFYMLKSFTLKQFDIARRECFQKMKQGNVKEGMGNLLKLSTMFVICNASADYIKDFLLGRDTDPEDMLVDNILRLFGFSKYLTWQARMEGVGTAAMKQILPPFKFINAFYKDVTSLGDEKGFETVQSIPLVGKLYYWWFGKGSKKKNKKKETVY